MWTALPLLVALPLSGSSSLVLVSPSVSQVNAAFSSRFTPGTRILTTADSNVYDSPSTTTLPLGTQPASVTGTVVSGPLEFDGVFRWQVDYDSGADGWSNDSELVVNYFPRPERQGGWRSLVSRGITPAAAQIAEIRSKTGLDWNKLKLAADLSASLSPKSSMIVVRNGWIAGEWGPTSAVNLASVTKSLTGLAVGKLFDLSSAGTLERQLGQIAWPTNSCPQISKTRTYAKKRLLCGTYSRCRPEFGH